MLRLSPCEWKTGVVGFFFPPLAYGRALTLGSVRCVSATNGVTCRRLDGRRVGFRVAREGYTLYR
jgi:hypothetical protein